MQLRYRNSDNDDLAMGDALTPKDDYTITEVDFPIPSDALVHYTFSGVMLMRKSENAVARLDAVERFNFDVLTGKLNQTLSPESAFKLRHEIAPMREYLSYWKNFAGVKALVAGLLAVGLATQDEYDQVKACFADQNINLDEF